MNSFHKVLAIGALLFLIPLYVQAEITRTLRQGDRGLDVKELQVFLNSDPDTRVATSGVGSPGYETTYFGALTTLAVNRLQIKYAYQTLTPAGLSGPTGIVGAFTRALIYKMSTISLPAPTTAVLPTAEKPVITAITPTVVTRTPQTLTITGTGFTPYGNMVLLPSDGEQSVGTFASSDGTTITFPFVFGTAEKMRAQLARYSGMTTYSAILDTFVQNLTGTTVTRSGGRTYIRVIIKIKNANGESNAVTTEVDIRELLK